MEGCDNVIMREYDDEMMRQLANKKATDTPIFFICASVAPYQLANHYINQSAN
jgi:hypothetical protein